MQLLVDSGFYSISVEDWARCITKQQTPPGRPVIITFDGGYQNFSTNAWPILAERGLRATLFVVTERVGKFNDWDGDAGRHLALMDWNTLRKLQLLGNTIGSGSAMHRCLTQLSDQEIDEDCIAARAAIARELSRATNIIAFPWGRTNRRVRYVLAEGGYRCGLGTAGGLSTLSDDAMDLPRISILGDDDLQAFSQKIDLNPE